MCVCALDGVLVGLVLTRCKKKEKKPDVLQEESERERSKKKKKRVVSREQSGGNEVCAAHASPASAVKWENKSHTMR